MNGSCLWVIPALACIAVYQTHAMNSSSTQLQEVFEQRKKLEQEKWRIQREIEGVNWQLWWYDVQYAFKNPRMHFWLHQRYYIKCTVTAVSSIAVGALTYRVYSNKNKKNESDKEEILDDNEGNADKQSKNTVGRNIDL